MTNPYDGEVLFELCQVNRGEAGSNGRDKTAPQIDYGDVVYTFPPAGPVQVKHAANFSEKENKSSGASTVEDKQYDKPVDINLALELLTDDPTGQPGEVIVTAQEKLRALEASYFARDEYGRRILYAPQYPTVGDDVQFVFFAKLEHNDTLGTDKITVRVTFHQWTYVPPKKKTSSSSAASSESDDDSDDSIGPQVDEEVADYIRRIREEYEALESEETEQQDALVQDAMRHW